MTRPRLHLSHDGPANRLSALEFGRVDDGQPDECWELVADDLGLLHDEPGGRCVGFLLVDLAGYDVDAPEHADLWEEPRFDVPALGLTDVAPNAVIVAARALYGDRRSVDRELFSAACNASGELALERWLRCLQAGDSMAHQALGYTLYELGRLPEAYRHTRHYCEIAPAEPWAWCWFGKVAAAMGEDVEAIAAFERAVELEDDDEPTDAVELLERLRTGDVDVPRLRDARAPAQDLAELASSTSLDHERRTTGDGGFVLFDTAPIPAWLDCDADGALRVRAGIGYVLWDDRSAGATTPRSSSWTGSWVSMRSTTSCSWTTRSGSRSRSRSARATSGDASCSSPSTVSPPRRCACARPTSRSGVSTASGTCSTTATTAVASRCGTRRRSSVATTSRREGCEA